VIAVSNVPNNEAPLVLLGLAGFGLVILCIYAGFIDKRLFDYRELVALSSLGVSIVVTASFMRYGAALARFTKFIEGLEGVEGDRK
jgi:hypothetical protein